MDHLLQVAYEIKKFEKPAYKALDKHILKKHPDYYYSNVKIDDAFNFVVPVSHKRKEVMDKAEVVICIDKLHQDEMRAEEKTQLMFIKQSESGIPFLVFSFQLQNDQPVISLNYLANKHLIGEPERDDFFLVAPQSDHAYVVYINGYIEHSHHKRIYTEHVYFMNYFKEPSLVAVKSNNFSYKTSLKIEGATVIDLRRLFY